jgi:tol-pal system protein YbgF
MISRRTAALVAFSACLAHATGTFAQAPVVDARDLDERLKRLERLIGSEGLLKLFEEVESLGTEVRELRGQLEVQSHTIEQLKQRQRQLYLDTDQRLQKIESAPPAQAASPLPQPSVPAATAPAGQTAEGAVPMPDPAPAASGAAGTTETAGVDPFAEQQAYQGAFDLLKAGRYEDAAGAFQQFIVEYPTGSYADNAQYWLGETYYITRRFAESVQEFQRLVVQHPNSQKLTHALLKIGYAHDELGNRAEAERVLGDLIARYPQSAAAGLARKRLVSIRQ